MAERAGLSPSTEAYLAKLLERARGEQRYLAQRRYLPPTGELPHPSDRVPYDEDLAACGIIQPDLERVIVGWANEAELIEAGATPILELGSACPVGWVAGEQQCPEPEPVVNWVLYWWRTV